MFEIPIRFYTSTSCFRAKPVYNEGYPFATIQIYAPQNPVSSVKTTKHKGSRATIGFSWR